MILNRGITKTAFIDNIDKQIKHNEIKWKADYDGNLANLSVMVNDNGNKKFVDMEFTNDDLSKLLSIPSDSRSLDKRLLADYNNVDNIPSALDHKIIYLPLKKQSIINKPLLMPLTIKKSKKMRHIPHRKKSHKIKSHHLKSHKTHKNKYSRSKSYRHH